MVKLKNKNMGFIIWPREIALSDLKKNSYAYTLYSYCCSKANFQSVVSKETNFEKGSFLTSRNKLHDEFGWDKKTIDKSLDQLVKLHLIVKEPDKCGTKITIIDYEKFQGNHEKVVDDINHNHEKVVEEIHHNQIESGGRNPPQSRKSGGRYPPKVVDEIHPNNNIYKNNINSRAKHDTHSKESKIIIDYLNDKTGKKYRYRSKGTQRIITARLNEGFTVEDFKTVIDNKVNDWLNDTKMSLYLRPETLFGNKFEGYLNQNTTKKKEFHLPTAKEI